MNLLNRPKPGKSKTFRIDIQRLRGVAVLAVILFHSKESLFPNGYLGVDAFFIISGFVVAPLLREVFENKTNDEVIKRLLEFYLKRFWRLIPTLGFVLGVSVFLVIFLASPSEHWRIAQQGIYTLFLNGNIGAVKFSGNYFSPTPNPFIHTWSLSVEEQFYIGIPLIFLFAKIVTKKSITGRTPAACIWIFSYFLFAAPSTFSDIYSEFGFPNQTDFTFYSALPRAWQFILGYCAYLISQKNFRKSRFVQKANIGFILLLILLFSSFQIPNRAGSTLVGFFTLLALMIPPEDGGIYAVRKFLEWLGDRSYSLYLVHMPLIYLAKYSPVFAISNRPDRSIQTIFAVSLTLILGHLLFVSVENQSRSLGRTPQSSQNDKVKFLSITLALPVILLLILNYGVRHNYWGLMENLKAPTYAGFLDPVCQRDSDSGPPCKYLEVKSKHLVLLIGDSHAGMYSEAVISAAKQANWSAAIWAKSSCSFVIGKDHTNSLSESCLKRNKEIYNWVHINKPNAVIVSQFIYQSSNEQDLERSLLALKKLVPKILIVANNPIFPDEKDFMVARPLLMKSYLAPKFFRVANMQYRDHAASTKVTSWAHNIGFETLIPWPLFCDMYFCHRFDKNDGWLYIDDDHLSVGGANRAVPQIARFLSADNDEY